MANGLIKNYGFLYRLGKWCEQRLIGLEMGGESRLWLGFGLGEFWVVIGCLVNVVWSKSWQMIRRESNGRWVSVFQRSDIVEKVANVWVLPAFYYWSSGR